MNRFAEYIWPGARGHLVGIGGVSMSPLAEVLSGMGLYIRGSDIRDGDNVARLRKKGIDVLIGHRTENITPELDFVVRTAAVHDDNPEIAAAHALGIPVFERTEAWGAIMLDYKNAICISGTHGKTTTTSMTTHILMAAQMDPTVMIGSTLPLLHAGHRVGQGDTIIMESCEYCNSFLNFYPTVGVILGIEADHLDFFKDLADIQNSFCEFASHVPPNGTLIVNMDDANTMEAVRPLGREMLTFGLTDAADLWAKDIRYLGTRSDFDVMYHGSVFTHVTLHVPGLHNVKNALAACAAAISVGCDPLSVKYGLAAFNGAGRRFEFKSKFNGADVYDDYAHHPGELKALLDATETLGYKRRIVVFQPHTYSRTKALFEDFILQLGRADMTILAEIYAAREQNTVGISSRDLAVRIPNAMYFDNFAEIVKTLRFIAAPGDLILTIGAGDIYKVGEQLTAQPVNFEEL
ncbi:MAG: UDP-N-acetylmuramate--L-alanine ligase [Oscillospiraceae bacterium]|nr:UDP-N-acetylmuramate--L-alanine ligase [Oscillospiraceae bacterium]